MDMRRKPISQKAGREKEEQGFTLTEIAIVLGIIGLILGAIWVAAAAVYTNMRTSKTTTELLDVVQNVRKMYATSGTVDPGADMTTFGVQAGKTLTYIQGGVFPADTLNAAATAVQDPWNGYIAVRSGTAIVAGDSFQVAFDAVPTQACINVITSTTGVGRDPGLIGVSTAAAGALPALTYNTAMPVLASTSQTLCTLAATQSMGFTFKLK